MGLQLRPLAADRWQRDRFIHSDGFVADFSML